MRPPESRLVIGICPPWRGEGTQPELVGTLGKLDGLGQVGTGSADSKQGRTGAKPEEHCTHIPGLCLCA